MRSRWRTGAGRRARPETVARLLVRTFSELCLTVGTLIVLFVVYVLWWTGFVADRAMAAEIDRLRADRAAAGPAAPGPTADPDRPRPGAGADTGYRVGRVFAEMRIPRFGPDWHKPVLEGTDPDTLARGLGHYPDTARAGAVGNFAVAGHRRTHGDPFKDFPELRPGDLVVITDASTRYTYTIRGGPHRTLPSDVRVVDPVPRSSPFTGPGRYLTLTTCDPEWGHSHRLIVWAELTDTRAARAGSP
ncbi:class E sortase [Streptomyces sp. BI20]|uniref:class E sortase n=1 Tax=Streptomyces sp. BI20 TaxID=3403460 RepID=UPI003C76766A